MSEPAKTDQQSIKRHMEVCLHFDCCCVLFVLGIIQDPCMLNAIIKRFVYLQVFIGYFI